MRTPGVSRRWAISAALVGLVVALVVGYSGAWTDTANANGTGGTGGTGPTHIFSFDPNEITLDPVSDSEVVSVRLDGLLATVVTRTVQVSIVHDDTTFSISGISCIDRFAGASSASARIVSEGATSIVCTNPTTAPVDGDDGNVDGLISGNVLQFTITRLAASEDTSLTFVQTGPWQTNVIESGLFVPTALYNSLNVLKNHEPVADDQAQSLDEDIPLGITLTGSDVNGDSLTFTIETGPTNGSLSGTAPDVTYTPDADFFGADSFTFSVFDGALSSLVDGTVDLTIDPVNDAPTFTLGPDQSVVQEIGAVNVPGWATGISPGPANESSQLLAFSVTGNTQPGLFTVAPSVDETTGDLTYSVDPTQSGTATITLTLTDDGGTANGGVDSTSQDFDIDVIETRSIIGDPGTITLNSGLGNLLAVLTPQVTLLDVGLNTVAGPVAVAADGSFTLDTVPVGTYTLQVELPGFQTGEASGLLVNGGGNVSMDVVDLLPGFVTPNDVVDGLDLSTILGHLGVDSLPDRTDGLGNIVNLDGDTGNVVNGPDIDLVTGNLGITRTTTWNPL